MHFGGKLVHQNLIARSAFNRLEFKGVIVVGELNADFLCLGGRSITVFSQSLVRVGTPPFVVMQVGHDEVGQTRFLGGIENLGEWRDAFLGRISHGFPGKMGGIDREAKILGRFDH